MESLEPEKKLASNVPFFLHSSHKLLPMADLPDPAAPLSQVKNLSRLASSDPAIQSIIVWMIATRVAG